MNDEELDLLASAYVDGEATPDEVALVERDPELRARVEAFRAVTVDGSVAPPPGLADRHVAAAMAEFEAIAPGAAPTSAPVVDLRARSARRGRRDRRQARTMPAWLPAAAGFVIVGGGVVWAVGQTGGSDDTTDAAEVAIDTDAGSDEGDASGAPAANGAESGEETAALAEEATEESADESAEAESAEDSTRSAEGGSAAAPSDDTTDDGAGDAEADFAVPEPQLFFDDIPDPDSIDDLPEPEPDLELSLCGPEIATAALGEPLGFIPVEVEGQPAELYLFADGDGTEIRVLVDDDCQPLAP